MQNRRNLYRLLHVQHDAPAEVIKASYRTIMQTLRQHPDLGGNAELAQAINDAVATLCDPNRRERYDDERSAVVDPTGTAARRYRPSGVQPAATAATAATSATSATSATAAATAEEASLLLSERTCDPGSPLALTCLFCSAVVSNDIRSGLGAYIDDSVCQRCGGARHPSTHGEPTADLLTRESRRAAHDVVATLWLEWPWCQPLGVRIIDLSTTGVALQSPVAIGPSHPILLKSSTLSAIAQVQYSEQDDDTGLYRTGLQLYTLKMRATPGGTVRLSA